MSEQATPVPAVLELDVSKWVRRLVKYGPALTLACFLAAFLYDGTYWWIVSRRVLGLYVLSDHIETAVTVIFFVVLATITLYSVGTVVFVVTGGRRRITLAATALVMVAFPIFSVWNPNSIQPIEYLAAVCALVLPGLWLIASISRRHQSWAVLFNGMPETIPILSPLYVAMLFAVMMLGMAVKDGHSARHITGQPDQVELVPTGLLKGKVLRVIDRGVILHEANSPAIRFIPKEQVKRIVFDAVNPQTP